MNITSKDIAIVASLIMVIPMVIGFGAMAAIDRDPSQPIEPTPAVATMTPTEILNECDARSAWGLRGADLSRDDMRLPKSMKLDRDELMRQASVRGGRNAVLPFNLGWGYAREGYTDKQIQALLMTECFDDFGVTDSKNGAN